MYNSEALFLPCCATSITICFLNFFVILNRNSVPTKQLLLIPLSVQPLVTSIILLVFINLLFPGMLYKENHTILVLLYLAYFAMYTFGSFHLKLEFEIKNTCAFNPVLPCIINQGRKIHITIPEGNVGLELQESYKENICHPIAPVYLGKVHCSWIFSSDATFLCRFPPSKMSHTFLFVPRAL